MWFFVGCPWNEKSCSEAAFGGHLNVLRWLRMNGCPWDRKTIFYAVRGGHLNVLKWAYANSCPFTSIKYQNIAAVHGRLDVLKWYSESVDLTSRTMEIAAEAGHRHIVEWMNKRGYDINFDIIHIAAKKGHMELLKWAYAQGYALSNTTCNVAAANGHLDVLHWLLKKKCPYDYKQLYKDAAYDLKNRQHIKCWLASTIFTYEQNISIMTTQF